MSDDQLDVSSLTPVGVRNARRVSRLRTIVQENRRQLLPFREKYREAVEEFVGGNYGDGKKKTPFPWLAVAVFIYTRLLSGQHPKVLVRTRSAELRSSSWRFEVDLNHTLKEMNYQAFQEALTLQAMFTMAMLSLFLWSR